MTDLASLPLPTWAVPSQPRQAAVDEHTVRIRAQWWRDAIASRGLPGMSPVGPTLTRAQVWTTTADVFTLLWRALAWGSGSHLRQNSRRRTLLSVTVVLQLYRATMKAVNGVSRISSHPSATCRTGCSARAHPDALSTQNKHRCAVTCATDTQPARLTPTSIHTGVHNPDGQLWSHP